MEICTGEGYWENIENIIQSWITIAFANPKEFYLGGAIWAIKNRLIYYLKNL